ncbi:hypothetical protein VTL71DRAFT_12183 [Oculimacula yallundae]|uniref:Uncharacterized protein n=1 Tax=Oculimacula yallundae TaxID=86028 RepID=A0ABR4CSA0_9HELO
MLTSFLLLSLSTLSLALPTTSISSIDTCTTPSSFTISRFSKFTPSSSNPNPARVSFRYSDDSGLVSSSCLLMGSTSTGAYDPPVVCENPDVRFSFEGNQLTVWENLPACNTTEKAQVKGSIYVGTYCYPSPAGVPLGEGTSCQTPSVSLGGSLTAVGILGRKWNGMEW